MFDEVYFKLLEDIRSALNEPGLCVDMLKKVKQALINAEINEQIVLDSVQKATEENGDGSSWD